MPEQAMRCGQAVIVGFALALSTSVGCGTSTSAEVTMQGDGGDAGIDANPEDGAVDIPTSRSAFGIFAGFTREFFPYEQAAGLTHAQYLDWAGSQYSQLGAHWTRSNLQLLWDLVEPGLGGPYDWSNPMGTDECFRAAADAGVHYLAVFHEGGVLDPTLRSPFDHPEEYQRFVRDVVERYDADGLDDAPGSIRISHWQVGNETPAFSDLADGPDVYVAWFALTAEAVRQADPEASMVLVGSTDGSSIDSLHAQAIPSLAQAGVRFDAVDIHHWATADDVEIRAAAQYRSLLDSLGLEEVELWSTEHGTHVGAPTPADAQCTPPCLATQVCVQPGPTALCVPRCTSNPMCPEAVPVCNLDTGQCVQPLQSLADQARSLVQRYVVNRDAGVRLILWNNLVSWHEFGGHFGGVYDRMGLVSGGFLEFETSDDRGKPRPSWFAFRMLADKTDELWAQRLGPLDLPHAYVSAYRNRKTGVTGWVAWARQATASLSLDVPPPSVRVTSFLTDEHGHPERDELVAVPPGGVFTTEIDRDPVWIEPVP